MQKLRLILPIMFAFILFAGLLSPVSAGDGATISVQPQITTVDVGNSFDVQIWIKDLTTLQMDAFRFILTWDKTQMMMNGHSINLYADWTHQIQVGTTNTGLGYFTLEMTDYNGGNAIASDRYWETFHFECLAAGSSPLNLVSTITDQDGSTQYFAYISGASEPIPHTLINGDVEQISSSAPSNPYHHVGGEVFSANKLAVLSPYLALIGVVAVAAIVAKRKFT